MANLKDNCSASGAPPLLVHSSPPHSYFQAAVLDNHKSKIKNRRIAIQ